MKKSFTLIELIVVMVIMGILATIAVEILLKVSQNYAISRAENKIAFEEDLVINKIAAKMENRIPNSVIASECNLTNNDCIKGNVKDFISIQDLTPKNAYKYPVIEWLSKDYYSRRGEWNASLKKIIPGWAGFVDLKKTEKNANDDYNVTLPYSKMSIIQDIDGNWTKEWGINGYQNVFENNLSVLIFSGSDGRGAFNDINHSYGWYETLDSNNSAQKVFAIVKIIKDDLANTKIRVKTIDDTNDTTVYEGFFIVKGAEAIVPSYNADTNDYNLTFIQNYYPWKDENYSEGNFSLLATHVVQFKFREEGGMMRIYLCIQNPKIDLGNNQKLTICKEKVVF